MKEFTLGKSPMNVNCVVCVLDKQETYADIKEFTLVTSLLNVNIVGSALD